jgi:hypothetical protein
MAIHIGGSGLPCVDASTGNIKLHSGDCCEDCSACTGSGTDNAPLAYKATFALIDHLQPTPVCSQANCRLYNISYVVSVSAHVACNWVNATDVPDRCSVANPEDGTVEIIISHDGTDGEVAVDYSWGHTAVPTDIEIKYVKPYSGAKVPCLTFSSLDIPYSSNVGVGSFCDVTSSTCKLTAL